MTKFSSAFREVAQSYNVDLGKVFPAAVVLSIVHWWFRGYVRTILLFMLFWYPLMFMMNDLRLKKVRGDEFE